MNDRYCVYILHTSADTFYIGQTKNLEKRMAQHRSKSRASAKYMKYFDSFKLVYVETAADRSAALKQEAALRRLTRKQKEALVLSYLPPKN